jgi:hypothetical protein
LVSGSYVYADMGPGSGPGYTYEVTPSGDNKEWTVLIKLTGQSQGTYDYTI